MPRTSRKRGSREVVTPLHQHPNQPAPCQRKWKHNIEIPTRPIHESLATVQPQHTHKRQHSQVIKRLVLRGMRAKLLINTNGISGVKAYRASVDVLDTVGVREEGVRRRGVAPAELLERCMWRCKVTDNSVYDRS